MIWKWTIFVVGTRNENLYFSDANYSIKHNINMLVYNILQINVYLRIQNLKINWKLVHKRRHYSHFYKVCFQQKSLTMKIATFKMQITQKNTIWTYYFIVFYIYMCVSGFRILKKIENWFANEGARAISVRYVFMILTVVS